jgi:UDP-glucuronate 4-epimerase
MKILVTGVAGFIGFHLTKRLLEDGHEVIGLDNINDYYDVTLKYGRLLELGIEKHQIQEGAYCTSSTFGSFQFIRMDLSDTVSMQSLFESNHFDGVCHLAAQAGVRYSLENPMAYIDSNIIGFTHILEGCRHQKVGHLVYASSSSVYGLNQSQPFSTSHHTDHPVSLYAATKKSNELMAHTYSHLYDIPTTGLRFFTVYGEWGRPDMAPMIFTKAILEDKEIKIFNHGKMSRDFTYIADIVEGIMKVLFQPASPSEAFDATLPNPSISSAPYRIYNIGNNAPVSLMEFVETIEESLGKKAKKQFLPMQAGDVESTYADTSDLMKDFHYQPHTPLKEGIDAFTKWYQSFYSKEEE